MAAVLAAFLLVLAAPGRAQGVVPGRVVATAGNPTWVFVVGLTQWRDKSYAPFPQEGRQDGALVQFFRSQGVPEDHIVYLRDAQATKAGIEREFAALLAKSRKGDSLFFYFEGHGGRVAGRAAYFIPYDAGDDLPRQGWSVESVVAQIQSGFRGARAFVAADCCYAGALVRAVARHRGRVSFLALASSDATTPSTTEWTFTDALLAGLQGEPLVDRNRDGQIVFSELADYIESQMAFREGQLSSDAATGSFGPLTAISKVSRALRPREGERVQARAVSGEWVGAEILEARGGRLRLRYPRDYEPREEWVDSGTTRPFVPQRPRLIGQRIMARSHGEWHPGVIVDYRRGVYRVHFDDYGHEWDEWVGVDWIKDLPQAAKASPQK